MSKTKTSTTRFTLDARPLNAAQIKALEQRLAKADTQEEAAKLAALRNAAKIGLDAIECGDSILLETDQDIANLVRQAGERALKKRMVFLSKQLSNSSV